MHIVKSGKRNKEKNLKAGYSVMWISFHAVAE